MGCRTFCLIIYETLFGAIGPGPWTPRVLDVVLVWYARQDFSDLAVIFAFSQIPTDLLPAATRKWTLK